MNRLYEQISGHKNTLASTAVAVLLLASVAQDEVRG
jgi:hypothetical protein